MAAVGDVLRVVPQFSFLGQLVSNRYHYRIVSTGSAATDEAANIALADRFEAVVLDAQRQVTSGDMNYERLFVQNLNSLDGDRDRLLTGTGTVPGSPYTSLIAATYQLIPADKTIKFGRKSIGGLSEADVEGNGFTGGAQANFDALGTALIQLLSDPVTGATFAPVIARILPAEARPYVPYAVQIVQYILRNLGTQYTRRAGNGA